MTLTKVSALLFLTCAATVGLDATVASAFERKAYPGTVCVETDTTNPSIKYTQNAGAQNAATSYRSWICSLVRDNVTKAVSQWELTFHRHGNTSADWTVTLFLTNSSGTAGYGRAISVQKIAGFDTDYAGGVSNYENYGQLRIWTSVPPSCEITRIMVDEEGTTQE